MTLPQTPNGSGSVVSTPWRYSARMSSVGIVRAPVSGLRLVTMQRPTLPQSSTSAWPIRTRRPIQVSSSCGSTPSTPKSIRKRRGSIGSSTPPAFRIASSEPVERSDTDAGRRSRPAPGSTGWTRRSGRPTNVEIASDHGPSTRRPSTSPPSVEVRRHPLTELDHSRDDLAGGEAEREEAGFLDPLGDDLDEWRELLAVQKPALRPDQVEAPVVVDPVRPEVDLVPRHDGEALDGRDEDPGEAGGHGSSLAGVDNVARRPLTRRSDHEASESPPRAPEASPRSQHGDRGGRGRRSHRRRSQVAAPPRPVRRIVTAPKGQPLKGLSPGRRHRLLR